MWIVAHYLPVALFSLKPASATSSGGRTLLCPTPFAVKMALLDAALRTLNYEQAVALWPNIRDLRLQVSLPHRISVINTFTKIVRPKKNGPSDDHGTGLLTPLGNTIAYREYVSFGGSIGLALQPTSDVILSAVASLLTQINYFGKRGSFMQLQTTPISVDEEAITEDRSWVALTDSQSSFAFGGTLQVLDDCGAKMSFEQANIYSPKRIMLGKERVLRHIVLPYQATCSSRGFTLYERITP